MEIEDYIEKIINNGNVEDMQELSEILENVMEDLKQYDEECYKEYEMDLYKMAYGTTITKKMAEEIVSKMRPYRMRWSMEETKELQDRYGLSDIKPTDFFVVINSAYNDYKDIFDENIEMYVRFTKDFIRDEDAGKDKVFKYFTQIPL